MTVDWADALQVMDDVSRTRSTTGRRMQAIIDWCASCEPHPDWSLFRSIPFDDDVAALLPWFTRTVKNERPIRPLRAIWVGITHPILKDDPDHPVRSADMYFTGCPEFDGDDGECAWAEKPHYVPAGSFAESRAMERMYRTAYAASESLGNDAEYPLCLAYAVFAVLELLPRSDLAVVMRGVEKTGVAVGFDGGDALVLGELQRNGTWLRHGL